MFSLIKQWKLTDLRVKNIVFTDDSVKRQITYSISENLTDLDLESTGGFLSNCWKSSVQQIIYIDSTISNTENGIAVRDIIFIND